MKKQNLPIIIALSALSVTSFGCCSCFGLNLLFHDDTASDVSAPIVVTTTKPPTSAPTTATSTEPLILELPTEPPSKPITELSVTFLDVGQGDAAFIGCDGHYMLIDGGDTDSSSKMYSVMPEYAVISVGKNNEYGHPTDTVLSRLRDAETAVYRTDLRGDITFISDGYSLSVDTDKKPMQMFSLPELFRLNHRRLNYQQMHLSKQQRRIMF